MDKHRRVPVAKRPLGVSIMIEGGLKGYSGCNNQVNNGDLLVTGLKCIKSTFLQGI